MSLAPHRLLIVHVRLPTPSSAIFRAESSAPFHLPLLLHVWVAGARGDPVATLEPRQAALPERVGFLQEQEMPTGKEVQLQA